MILGKPEGCTCPEYVVEGCPAPEHAALEGKGAVPRVYREVVELRDALRHVRSALEADIPHDEIIKRVNAALC